LARDIPAGDGQKTARILEKREAQVTLEDVLTFLSSPERALEELANVIQKAVEALNTRQEQVRVDVRVTAIEQTADMLEEAKLRGEGK
jgi:hypothetical protein